MGPSACFFSRSNPGKSTSKKLRGFLSLPGEVRNQIYSYYFESEFRCEIAAKGSSFDQNKAKTVKLWAGAFQTNSQHLKYDTKPKENAPTTIRISRSLGKYKVVQGLQTNWFASLFAINLVCKKLHAETLPFIYQKTTFVFDAPNRITNFLGAVPKSKLKYITKLDLHYTTYGNPKFANDCIWQDKHRKSWIRACGAVSKKLVGLRSLKIWIRVVGIFLRFNLREAWILPLLQFRRLTRAPTYEIVSSSQVVPTQQPRNLQHIDIDFQSHLSRDAFDGIQQLARANEDLHRLLGEAIKLAILGAKEEEAMVGFNTAWEGKHAMWQHHLNFAGTGW